MAIEQHFAVLVVLVSYVCSCATAQTEEKQPRTGSDDSRPTLKRTQPESDWENDQRKRDAEAPQQATVVDVRFEGANDLPPAIQEQLAELYKGKTFEDAGWMSELRERARDACQQLGYFRAEVESRVAGIDSTVSPARVVAQVAVREGNLYRLGQIRWKNVTVFPLSELRPLFPLQDGEVFNTEKVREGIQALRQAYSAKGYINFSPVPDAQIDDASRTVSLEIDVDEGGRFKIRSIRILEGDEAIRQSFLTRLRTGEQFDPTLLERIFEELRPQLPKGREMYNVIETVQDNAAHQIDIIVDLRSLD